MAVAALAMGWIRRRERPATLIWFVVASTSVAAAVAYGNPRFRLPVEPVLVAFAAGFVARRLTRSTVGATP